MTCEKCGGTVTDGKCMTCKLPVEDLPLAKQRPRMVRRSDPDTSREAAAKMTDARLTQIQQEVLAWFRKVKRATDEMLENHFREKYPAQTTVSKRRTDLKNLDLLRDSGERWPNSNNRKMIVWEYVEHEAPHSDSDSQ